MPENLFEGSDSIVSCPYPSAPIPDSLQIEQEAKPNPAVSSVDDHVLGSQLVVSRDETLVREGCKWRLYGYCTCM